ncbi:MAG: HAD-IA family hydrolase [Betaproteobacteria bacterium]|nr:HAD-IA family hydrolase [Betaproteobacteria bacterium]
MRRAVLLDMGGVLVELGGEKPFLELLGGNHTRESMWRMWLDSPAVRAHETGRMETKAFAEAAVAEFGLRIGPEAFLAHFASWIVGPYEGVHGFLEELSARHETAILTNISAIHTDIVSDYGLFERVRHVFASHLIGEIKPDRAYFEHVLDRMNLAPHEAVFLDDNEINAEGARACGIEAHVVRGLAETRETLARLGFLPG